jgi:hypothetical protein
MEQAPSDESALLALVGTRLVLIECEDGETIAALPRATAALLLPSLSVLLSKARATKDVSGPQPPLPEVPRPTREKKRRREEAPDVLPQPVAAVTETPDAACSTTNRLALFQRWRKKMLVNGACQEFLESMGRQSASPALEPR